MTAFVYAVTLITISGFVSFRLARFMGDCDDRVADMHERRP